jgi:hypothetical protein
VKLDAEGRVLWGASFGGTQSDRLRAAVAASDGGYVLAGTTGSGPGGTKSSAHYGEEDGWVIRIDSEGRPLWDMTYGGFGLEQATSLAPAPDGGVMVGTYSLSGLEGNKTVPSQGFTDFWLLKLAPEDCDADGVPDFRDAFSRTAPGDAVDEVGCSIGQYAPCDGPWKSHGDYVSAIVEITARYVRQGWITPARRRDWIRRAARSDCGNP